MLVITSCFGIVGAPNIIQVSHMKCSNISQKTTINVLLSVLVSEMLRF